MPLYFKTSIKHLLNLLYLESKRLEVIHFITIRRVSFELQKICWTEIDTLDSDKKSVRNVTVKFILPVEK